MSTTERAREALREELAQAVLERDRTRVEAAAVWLRTTGTPLVEIYEVLLEALAGQLPEYASTPSEHLDRQSIQELVLHLVGRLGVDPGRLERGQVLMVVDGPRLHVLGMPSVAHVLEDAGWQPVHALGLTLDDLETVLRELPDPVAVVLALNDPSRLPQAKAAVGQVRLSHPRVKVLVSGKAAQTTNDLAAAVGAHAHVRRTRDVLEVLEAASNPLSPREVAVLSAVARGMSNPDAGEHLGVAAATVKTHLDRVFAKLGTSDRTATVALAMRRGWID